jgi:hypothetical protein
MLRIRAALLALTFAVPVAALAGTQKQCGGSDTVDKAGPAIAQSSRHFVAEMQSLVKADDRQAIARLIDYPLLVNRSVGTHVTHARIRNRQQFLANYDRIFNAKVKAAILDPKSIACLFNNDQGFMIGDGQLWFQKPVGSSAYKVFSINP